MSVLVPDFRNVSSATQSPLLAKTSLISGLCSSQHLATNDFVTVNGGENGDIPTIYSVPSLRNFELLAVGNYVHKNIVPGFKYRVRINGTDNFLFKGHALRLDNVGQGYGKRLTFETSDILCNENVFWSDSNELGYAFSINVLENQTVFKSVRNSDGCNLPCRILSVDENQEIVQSYTKDDTFYVEVKVSFRCQFMTQHRSSQHEMHGKMLLLKKQGRRQPQMACFSAKTTNTGQKYSLYAFD